VAHLASVGFREIPEPIGALWWTGAGGGDAVLVASAVGYLAGARDGWEWFVDAVLAAGDRDAPWPTQDAASLGGLVARFHAAMATASPVIPRPLGSSPANAWHGAALATLEGAIADTDGPEGERLRAWAPRAREVLDDLALPGETPVLPIHGDLHVGQVLRWSGGDALSDFDGDPLAASATRLAPGPAARDVASMARAIDHVGRICQRRRPEREAAIRAWLADARAAFLDTYRGSAPAGVFDERLLLPLEVVQECHEYRYAAVYLPRWRYVPDLAMPELLELAR
jgi:maltokinase